MMGKCFSTENKWQCGYCMAKNSDEIKLCIICSTPRKWLCGNCNRMNPGSRKSCLYCFKEYTVTQPGHQQQQQKQIIKQPIQEEIAQKDVEKKNKDKDQHTVNNENTKPTNTAKKQTDNIENKVNEITKEKPNQESELKKETQSNDIEIELTKTDEESVDKTEDPKTKLLNNIKERRITVIGTHPQITTKFCNWIIGMSIFQRDVNTCQQAQVKLFRKKMKIAKTPDLASVSNPKTTMKKCMDMLAPGPHVFLNLVPIDNFTADDRKRFNQLNEWIGEKVFDFLILVLFSEKQNELSNEDVDSYFNQNEELTKCVQQCDRRFLAGSVFSSGETKVKYLQDLTDIIDNVISGNDGFHFEQETAEDNDWDMVMNSYREIAGVVEPGDVKILVKEGPVEVDPEKQLDRLKRGLDKLTGQVNTKM